MAYHDLRSFLARLEHDGQLVRVGALVDPDLESTALCLHVLREDGPALLMEQPVGDSEHSRHPLLGNLFGHRSRIDAALGGRPLASLRELGQLLASIKEPRWSSSLPRSACAKRHSPRCGSQRIINRRTRSRTKARSVTTPATTTRRRSFR